MFAINYTSTPLTHFPPVTDVDPVVLSLRIKFYPADPLRLTGNGKVLIYQQIKRDLIHGRLYCSTGEAAALGALIVQGKRELEQRKRLILYFTNEKNGKSENLSPSIPPLAGRHGDISVDAEQGAVLPRFVRVNHAIRDDPTKTVDWQARDQVQVEGPILDHMLPED